ncbi:hypothetical protein CCR75_005425 [Bremia lactucae]|uniref:RxLR effector protein n=1 Tax=Bremia lactucae TaxID=4779 RepID=A0A976FJU2_BRELC|nr:hypothetical protein CCR75_005425 [Bremia lactucae]
MLLLRVMLMVAFAAVVVTTSCGLDATLEGKPSEPQGATTYANVQRLRGRFLLDRDDDKLTRALIDINHSDTKKKLEKQHQESSSRTLMIDNSAETIPSATLRPEPLTSESDDEYFLVTLLRHMLG